MCVTSNVDNGVNNSHNSCHGLYVPRRPHPCSQPRVGPRWCTVSLANERTACVSGSRALTSSSWGLAAAAVGLRRRQGCQPRPQSPGARSHPRRQCPPQRQGRSGRSGPRVGGRSHLEHSTGSVGVAAPVGAAVTAPELAPGVVARSILGAGVVDCSQTVYLPP